MILSVVSSKGTHSFQFFHFRIGDILVPVAKLLYESGTSLTTLRQLALKVLFRYEPSGHIPSYALEYFGTRFTYIRHGKEIVVTRNEELTEALEIACTENLMEANENGGVILDIYCTFENRYTSRIYDGAAVLRNFISSLDQKMMKWIRT